MPVSAEGEADGAFLLREAQLTATELGWRPDQMSTAAPRVRTQQTQSQHGVGWGVGHKMGCGVPDLSLLLCTEYESSTEVTVACRPWGLLCLVPRVAPWTKPGPEIAERALRLWAEV